MKLLIVLCAVVAVVASTYSSSASFDQNSLQYGWNGPSYDPNPFYKTHRPRRHHRRHHGHGGRRGRRHHWDSSDSDSDSDSSSGSSEENYWFFPRSPFFPGFGGNVAQDSAASYGSASNDAPASSVYGSASNDAPTYTANDAPASSYGRK